MNQLEHSTSLYLRQHKNNPVEWRVWGEAALAEAKAKNLPILLSSGYASCHWCHVMAQESFADTTIAAFINAHFIPIKIDREERPEIDAIYMEALQGLGQPGGWPLTMFLDEEAAPFWGGTYFPNPARGGMIGFSEVLRGVAKLWAEKKDEVIQNRDALRTAALERIARVRTGTIDPKLVGRMAAQLAENFDLEKGGMRGAPKFANLPMVDFLWQEALHAGGTSNLSNAVLKTLRAICLGGIYDHIGGGVARYGVDENWHIPHFEKMLYDQGLLLWSLSEVWRETREPLFKKRVEEIVGFLIREMLVEDGFAATLDADQLTADGRKQEGAFYVWDETEIDTLLGKGSEKFKQAFGITPDGNWKEENTNVLSLTKDFLTKDFLTKDEENFAAEKKILFEARLKRPPATLDKKIIASWNGFALIGLAHAAWVFERTDWLDLAEDVFGRVEKVLIEEGRLAHSFCDGKRQSSSLLDDVAALALAAITLFGLTQKEFYLTRAKAYLNEAKTYFASPAGGGFFQSPSDATDVPLGEAGRLIAATDNVMPSANSILWATATHLFLLEGKRADFMLAEQIERGFGGDVVKNFPAHAGWLASFVRHKKLLHIVLVGDEGKLERALRHLSLPLVPIFKIKEGDVLPEAHPAFGKKRVEGKPTAFVCFGDRCLAPIGDEEILTQTLLRER